MNRHSQTLVRLLIRHAVIGFAIAICAVKAIIFVDFGGLGTLINGSDHTILATSLLTFGLGTTIASVQMAIAVMTPNTYDRDS